MNTKPTISYDMLKQKYGEDLLCFKVSGTKIYYIVYKNGIAFSYINERLLCSQPTTPEKAKAEFISFSNRVKEVEKKAKASGFKVMQVGLWTNHPDDYYLTKCIIFNEFNMYLGKYRTYYINHQVDSFEPWGEYRKTMIA